jgi:hypothetical protein
MPLRGRLWSSHHCPFWNLGPIRKFMLMQTRKTLVAQQGPRGGVPRLCSDVSLVHDTFPPETLPPPLECLKDTFPAEALGLNVSFFQFICLPVIFHHLNSM